LPNNAVICTLNKTQIKNQMKQFSKIIITTLFIAFLASCSKDKDAAPSSASVVGKWTLSSFSIKTDTKTVDATLVEIGKLDPDTATELENSIEFKADGSATSTSGTEITKGTYVFDSGSKILTVTDKDAAGVTSTFIYEVVSVSSSEMALGVAKSSKKGADGFFEFQNEDEELLADLFAFIVYTVKGLDADDEIEKAKSFQLLLKFKK
jgi:hypothetical protein